ncbi:MAG: AAA family ATPase [Rhodospirillales bacterium]|jgi:NadR type nicotinamide-nucleotide adenylyltransferase
MSQRFRHGLVVGKFSPLHRGHEFLIGRARSACDDLTVLSWSKPELPRCSAAVRRAWLKCVFPGLRTLAMDDAEIARLCRIRGVEPRPLPPNDASDDTHRAFCAWLCMRVLHVRPDAVFTSEPYGDGFAAHLSLAFRQDDPTHPGVTHCPVDPARAIVPVSGTKVREAPERWRRWVDPFVYADLVHRIAFLGGESSGKTTLANALAETLRGLVVPEYGRRYWEQTRQDLDLPALEHVGRTQLEHEIEAAGAMPPYLLCDTSPLSTLVYALLDHGRPSRGLVALARRRYDHVVVCSPDIPFVQDGTRRDASWRHAQHELTLTLLRRYDSPFLEVTGSVEDRMGQVLRVLQA